MAEVTTYICQPYTADKKGVLKAEAMILCANEGAARRRADRLLENQRAVGVDVVRQTADPNLGDYSEPEFVGRFGRVPTFD